VVNAENIVELREVRTERTVGNRWLISEGLNDGDQLITEGLQFVKPGDEVKTVAAGNVSESAAAAGQEG
jgi:membrane fusion protein (multidrug efflux system)